MQIILTMEEYSDLKRASVNEREIIEWETRINIAQTEAARNIASIVSEIVEQSPDRTRKIAAEIVAAFKPINDEVKKYPVKINS